MSIHLIELNSFSPQQNIFSGIQCRLNAYNIIYNNIMSVHNTCRHYNGYVEIEKEKCNVNVILSSHHASL